MSLFLHLLSEATMDHVGESDSLWLTREPEYEEIIADFANFNR